MLMNRLVNRGRKQKGFTLVELMVVVVIIGVLVAIAIPIFSGIQNRARASAIRANVRTLEGAVSMYISENGDPAAWTTALLDPEYIAEWPTGPTVAGVEVTYAIDGTTGAISSSVDPSTLD